MRITSGAVAGRFVLVLVFLATFVVAGGAWGRRGKWGLGFHGLMPHHHHPAITHQYGQHLQVPVIHNSVLPVPHPVYVPFPVRLGKRSRDSIIIVITREAATGKRKKVGKKLSTPAHHHQHRQRDDDSFEQDDFTGGGSWY